MVPTRKAKRLCSWHSVGDRFQYHYTAGFDMSVRVLFLALALMGQAHAEEVCDILRGASIIAQDDENTFLGKITNSFDSKSIFNEFGKYGNEFNSESIWNEFGEFGNEFNAHSPFNKYSGKPPMIIKDQKIIGHLSANKDVAASISPNLLKALCAEEL